MAEKKMYRVTMIAPTGAPQMRRLWGIVFMDGVAHDVPPGMALSSFKQMGYDITPEVPLRLTRGPLDADTKAAVEEVIAHATVASGKSQTTRVKEKAAAARKATAAAAEAPFVTDVPPEAPEEE